MSLTINIPPKTLPDCRLTSKNTAQLGAEQRLTSLSVFSVGNRKVYFFLLLQSHSGNRIVISIKERMKKWSLWYTYTHAVTLNSLTVLYNSSNCLIQTMNTCSQKPESTHTKSCVFICLLDSVCKVLMFLFDVLYVKTSFLRKGNRDMEMSHGR